jgi:hypothetical protein
VLDDSRERDTTNDAGPVGHMGMTSLVGQELRLAPVVAGETERFAVADVHLAMLGLAKPRCGFHYGIEDRVEALRTGHCAKNVPERALLLTEVRDLAT